MAVSTRSKKGETYALCTVCNLDFAIAHGGRDDCRRHINSAKHKDYAKLANESRPLSTFFQKEKADPSVNNVTLAEMRMLADLPTSTEWP